MKNKILVVFLLMCGFVGYSQLPANYQINKNSQHYQNDGLSGTYKPGGVGMFDYGIIGGNDTLHVGVNGHFMQNGAVYIGVGTGFEERPSITFGIDRFFDGDSVYAFFVKVKDAIGNDTRLNADTIDGFGIVTVTDNGAGKGAVIQAHLGDIQMQSFNGGAIRMNSDLIGLSTLPSTYTDSSFVQKSYVDNLLPTGTNRTISPGEESGFTDAKFINSTFVQLFASGVLVLPTTGYTINTTTGAITFVVPLVAGNVVSALITYN